ASRPSSRPSSSRSSPRSGRAKDAAAGSSVAAVRRSRRRPVFLYLHGFASGPGSTKAAFFVSRLRDLGATAEVPDLAPDFTHLTITSMLEIVEPLLARERTVLLGSSLGGDVAAPLAARPAQPPPAPVPLAPPPR